MIALKSCIIFPFKSITATLPLWVTDVVVSHGPNSFISSYIIGTIIFPELFISPHKLSFFITATLFEKWDI